MRLLIALAGFAAIPVAFADVVPPPPQHTALQDRLRGVWQEQSCHAPPAMHHGSTCVIRTVSFGDSAVAIISMSYTMGDTGTTAIAGSWKETSSDGAKAVIQVDMDSPPEWRMTFSDKDSFVIAAYGEYPEAQFKRVGPAN